MRRPEEGKTRTIVLALVIAACIGRGAAYAADEPSDNADDGNAAPRLVVGTKHSPPFAFKNPDGQWRGISIDMWRELANELELKYEFRELALDELLAQLESGDLDVAVAAISVTADRHQRVEFCHPHFSTGLGVAVAIDGEANSLSLLWRIVSFRMLSIIAGVVIFVVLCGMLIWVAERKKNTTMFGGGRRQGIAMGVWWSTILLLGHKGVFPLTAWGRVVGASSMVASIFLLSLITGIIASVLTVGQLETGIAHPSELRRIRTATVASSTSEEYLRQRQIKCQTYPDAEQALQTLAAGRTDAVVYDQALLKYLAKTKFAESVHVLPISFNEQEYAMALKPESPLRRPLNEALLRFRAGDSWDELVYRYLGD